MAGFGLVGPSYRSQSPNASDEVCMNWYVEIPEGQSGKSAAFLYGTPGTALFAQIPGPLRGLYQNNGRTFAVGGTGFYEVLGPMNVTKWGTVVGDGKPCSMVAGITQLAFISSGNLYVFNLFTNTFVAVGGFGTPLLQIDFADSWFSLLYQNQQSITWAVSAENDATTWPGLSSTKQETSGDNAVSLIIDHRYVWVFGNKKSQVYQNVGAAQFPYQIIPGSTIEDGSAATLSVARCDNSVFVLTQNERGGGMVKRTSGFALTRVSNFAVEYAIQQYQKKSTINDAVAYSYQDQGHDFYVLRFPAANATWVYDAATQLWHQRGYWNQARAAYDAHRSQCYCFSFGKHLVGDPTTGNIYDMNIETYQDNGQTLRRERVTPNVGSRYQYTFFNRLQIDLEAGLRPAVPLFDGNGDPRDPQIMLEWSDDGGHTWSNIHARSTGAQGKYRQRVLWNRMGKTLLGRIFRVTASDPVPYRIIEGDLDATPGFTVPADRISKQLQKVT